MYRSFTRAYCRGGGSWTTTVKAFTLYSDETQVGGGLTPRRVTIVAYRPNTDVLGALARYSCLRANRATSRHVAYMCRYGG